MKKALRVILLLICIAALLAPCASALVPYTTYTYDIDGNYVESPHAYVPDRTVSSADMGLKTGLSTPTDIVSDEAGNLYLADPNNNRIVILNADYTLNVIVSRFLNGQGVPDSFEKPRGLFVKDDEIFVCDTENNRIVVFDKTCDENGKITSVDFDRVPRRCNLQADCLCR